MPGRSFTNLVEVKLTQLDKKHLKNEEGGVVMVQSDLSVAPFKV